MQHQTVEARKEIVLLNPPLTPRVRYGALAAGGAVEPPYGILYLASALRRKGFPVRVLDAEALGLDVTTTAQEIARIVLNYLGRARELSLLKGYLKGGRVLALNGLRPILVDVDPQTLNLDPRQAERAIGKRTRVMIATHLFGVPCDLPRIMEVAGRHGIYVLEDCAQACGAMLDGRRVGSFGTAGFFSFDVIKPINTLTGGMVTTDQRALAARIRERLEGYPYRYGKLLKKIGLTYLEWVLSFPLPFALLVAPLFYFSGLMQKVTQIYLSAKATSRDTHVAFANLQAMIGLRQLEGLDARNQIVWQKAQRIRSCLKKEISSQRHLPRADPIGYFFVIRAGSMDPHPDDQEALVVPEDGNGFQKGPGVFRVKSLSQRLLLRGIDVGKGGELPPPELRGLRGQGSYAKFREALRVSRDQGIPVITNTVITRANLDCLGEIVDRAKKERFLAAFQPVDYYPGSSSEREEIERLSPTAEELQRVVAILWKRKARGAPILDSLTYLRGMAGYRSWKRDGCLAGRLRFALSPQGKIAPCDYLLPEKGNPLVSGQGLARALHSLCEMDPNPCTGCYCTGSSGLDMVLRLNAEAGLNALKGLRHFKRQGYRR